MYSPRRPRLPTTGELCGQMLRQMRAREEAAWFEHPVSLVDVPDYLALISHPMDYSTMGKKLADGEYSTSLLSFASDMRLIFRNALTYNWNSENEYNRAAKQVCSPQRSLGSQSQSKRAHHSAPLAPKAEASVPERPPWCRLLSAALHASAHQSARRQPPLCARAHPMPPVHLSSPAALRPDAAHDDAPTGRRP